MASLRICSGGNCSLSRSSNAFVDRRNPTHRRSSVTVAIRRGKTEITPHAATGRHRRIISRETIEEWVEESATEIVKNLANAPLLIQVIEEADGRRLEFQKRASAEMWGSKLKRRETGEGMILVEELKDGRDSRGVYWNGEKVGEEESTKAWGLVVQGRGLECGSVCYLLKTSRVGSSSSKLGCFCTHFCLMKVNDFDHTAERQLADVWLS